MTKGPISEVRWHVGVFNLQLVTLQFTELNFHLQNVTTLF